ncbi:hypothetical protein OVY29_01290 [Sphingopyxis sp. SE2]|jgi:acetolactate synthase small subunit|uniref:hypothetical protein n=1 Tax=unclassified Sphingopyxis TaxID=2614943 RepID=UPI00050DD806|nr:MULTISPECIES: hypothetical protein [unclassified Sphingopyxis]KGB55088.1 hypothetical protein FG95_02850 [Sphingopyxis sp. LC363]MDT7527300.1 hypothetical protein [Sphingopyxis sp. SE2]
MHRFRVDAILDPQSLPRVANCFAQRAFVPSALTMHVLPSHMRIEVVVAGLEAAQAAIIAAKLGEVVAVLRSEVEEIETAGFAADRAKPALAVVG